MDRSSSGSRFYLPNVGEEVFSGVRIAPVLGTYGRAL